MPAPPDLRRDPRWQHFARRYRRPGGVMRFCVEALQYIPSWQQAEMIEAFDRPNARAAFSSGHGTGKSRFYASAALYFLCWFPLSNTLLTATNITQVASVVWKEMADMHDAMYRSGFGWLASHIVIKAKLAYIAGKKGQWFVLPKTAAKGAAENIAGMHRKYYLVLMDEASGVPDNIIDVIKGGLTGGEPGADNRMVMASQPTRPVGRFAESVREGVEYRRAKDAGENPPKPLWDVRIFNAEESPLVSRAKVLEWLHDYNGHSDPQYQIKVLGRLPDNLEGYLIPAHWFDECARTPIRHREQWGWRMTVDVAEGVMRDSSCWIVSRVSGYGEERFVECVEMYETNKADEIAFAHRVLNESRRFENVTIAVDGDGPGRTVGLTLEREGAIVEWIRWGLPCHGKRDRERYRNLRAYACVETRNAMLNNRVRLVPSRKLKHQGHRIPYGFDDRGRYYIWPKDRMASEGIKSPDLFDVLAFQFLGDYIPVSGAAEFDTGESDDLMRRAMDILEIQHESA